MTKILLVDNKPDIVQFLKYNFEQNVYDVIVGNDGNEALDKLSDNPNLIILDIMMSHLDGYLVNHKIRENKNFRDVPIIFLTAKSGETYEITETPNDLNQFKNYSQSHKMLWDIKGQVNRFLFS